nr:lytic transglycosylase domain-containing protein [Acidisoma cellulosilyticum]
MMGLLAACAGHHSHLSASQQAVQYKDNARGSYAPPGPPDDPWGPYVVAASGRFDVPQSWIRSVIHVESGGNEYINGQLVTSGPGAMGLMQLMPDTYQELEAQYGLGDDPYNPRDNIMAGTAYLREMYDLFGSPGFLAAYNAGPQRLNQYLTDGRPLPSETTHYLAMIEPHIQGDMPGGRSPADQFAMNSMTAPSAAPYNGGGASDPNSLANTGGGLVGGGAGYLGGSGSHGGGAAMVAMNQVPASAPIIPASDDSATDALNDQQVTNHSAGLLANGGGAVPADLMVASNDPRPTPAQVDQQEASADAAVANGQANVPAIQQAANYQPAVGGYQPAVVEQSAVAAAPLPAVQPTFQVAPSYQNQAAPAATVPSGTYLAQNTPAPAAPTYTRPRVIAAGGVQDLSSEMNAPRTSAVYQPRAATGLHLIAPAEADPMPPLAGGAQAGGWGIQVGAYGSASDARHAVEVARHAERYQLASAHSIVMPVQVSQHTLYRARLAGLSQNAAVNACQGIRGRSPCMVLSPDAIGD